MAKWHELYDYSSDDGSNMPEGYHLNDKIKKEFVAIQQKIFDAQTKIHNYKTKKKLAKKQLEDKENIEQELQSLQDINNNNNNLTNVNKFLHFVGSIVYHSQDSEYFVEKKNIIKFIQKKPSIKKTVFREDGDSHVLALKNQPSCEVSSAKELILHRRLVDKSFKLELKNFKEAEQITPYTLSNQVHFSKFLPTRIENNTIGVSTKPEPGNKKQLYRKSYIADLASYDSDKDDYQKTLKYRWKDINFVKMNSFLKKVFNGKDVSLKDPNVETATEIISLLFVTETSRNSTTFFTAPIFLELLAADEINLTTMRFDDNFPMAMKEAVAASRHLDFLHFDKIKDIYDYMKGGAEQGKKLLLKENELFFKWLKLKGIDSTPKQWGAEIQKLILDWYGIAVKLKAAGYKKEGFEEDDDEDISPHKNDQGFQKQEKLVQNLIQTCIEYDKYHLSDFANSCDLSERKGILETLKYWYIEPIVKILINSKEELSEYSALHILRLILQDIECTQYGNTIFYGSSASKDFLEINKIFYETTLTFKEIKKIFLTVDYIIKEYLSHIEHQETEFFGLSQESTQMTYNDFSYNQDNYTNSIKYTQAHNSDYEKQLGGDLIFANLDE